MLAALGALPFCWLRLPAAFSDRPSKPPDFSLGVLAQDQGSNELAAPRSKLMEMTPSSMMILAFMCDPQLGGRAVLAA